MIVVVEDVADGERTVAWVSTRRAEVENRQAGDVSRAGALRTKVSKLHITPRTGHRRRQARKRRNAPRKGRAAEAKAEELIERAWDSSR